MLANDPSLMAKSEKHVAKLIELVAVIKIAVGVKRAEPMSLINTTINLSEHLQPVFRIRQKLVISRLVSYLEDIPQKNFEMYQRCLYFNDRKSNLLV